MQKAIYRFGGLLIASDFPLHGLEICQGAAEGDCDVRIRYAPISEEVASATAEFFDGRYSGSYNGRELLLSRGHGRFLLRDGEEILMDLAPASKEDEIRAYLLGAVFGALCHQRGIMPLHASAIDLGDGCAIFLGPSGAGKSTLVAALAQRGHEIISDDGCFLRVSTKGDVEAWPGIGGIRLWEDANAALGFDSSRTEQRTHGCNKHLVLIRPPRNPNRSRPLRGVYQLHRVPTSITEITPLRGADAVEAVMQNVYPPGLADRLGYQPQMFMACTALARNVPVLRLSRPWNFAVLDQGVDLLENHLREIA